MESPYYHPCGALDKDSLKQVTCELFLAIDIHLSLLNQCNQQDVIAGLLAAKQ